LQGTSGPLADSILFERNDPHEIQYLVRIAALVVALCFSVAAFAKPVVKTINITQTAKVGQVTLQAGEYRLSIDGNKVSIQRGKDQVANPKVAGRAQHEVGLRRRSTWRKWPGEEVRFYGQKRVFVFKRIDRQAPLASSIDFYAEREAAPTCSLSALLLSTPARSNQHAVP